MVDNEILKINNLTKIYHSKEIETKAVEDFTFNLEEGKFITIVGPSGCGKSTILSILADLEEKSSGEIYLKENKKIGYILQQDSLFNWRTVLEINSNLTIENKEYVLISTYRLKIFINSYPSQLSSGMRERIV